MEGKNGEQKGRDGEDWLWVNSYLIHRTALHYAAARRRYKLCKYLVKKGIDINIVDKDGKTALYSSVQEQVCFHSHSTSLHLFSQGLLVSNYIM